MPKATITRVPALETYKSSTNRNTGLYLQKLTQAQINTLNTPPTTDTQIFSNSTTGTVQIKNGGTVSNIVTLTPTTVQVSFNSTTGTLQINNAGVIQNINTSLTTATGQGLVAGSTPVILPLGTRDPVETGGNNNIQGFAYIDTSVNPNVIRYRDNVGWKSVTGA